MVHRLENHYIFGTEIGSNYHKDIGNLNYVNLQNELYENNGLFSNSKGYLFDGSSFDFNSPIYFFDWKEVLNQNLINKNNFKQDEIYIFINNNYSFNEKHLYDYASSYTFEPVKINIIKHENTLYQYNFQELLYSDEISYDIPIIYIPIEKQYAGQLNDKIFIFDGNLSDAQKYIDDISIKYGYSPTYRIVPLKSGYVDYYEYTYNNLFKSFTHLVVCLLLFFISSNLTLETDIELNKKTYFIKRIEGINNLNITFFKKLALPNFISIIIYLIINKFNISISSLIQIILCIAIIEMIMYLIYKKKIERIERE